MFRIIRSKSQIHIVSLLGREIFAAVKATLPGGEVRRSIMRFGPGHAISTIALPEGSCVEISAAMTIKAKARTLYISRPVKNADEIVDWAKSQGFRETVSPDDMHVTIAFSRKPVDWSIMGDSFDRVKASGGDRSVEQLGDKGAVVLRFENADLTRRWREIVDKGASWDYPGYKPHVTITYDGADIGLKEVKPYTGDLLLGPEHFDEVIEDWEKTIKEQ